MGHRKSSWGAAVFTNSGILATPRTARPTLVAISCHTPCWLMWCDKLGCGSIDCCWPFPPLFPTDSSRNRPEAGHYGTVVGDGTGSGPSCDWILACERAIRFATMRLRHAERICKNHVQNRMDSDNNHSSKYCAIPPARTHTSSVKVGDAIGF